MRAKLGKPLSELYHRNAAVCIIQDLTRPEPRSDHMLVPEKVLGEK
jgi:hypothetical protein